MPQQLIYTSAPRGIVAGRSGHCTVARSAKMREPLMLQLEKFCYYQHLSLTGGQERPIYSCRIVDIRGTRFHVLSRIQDAGLDFTGRTNFIAHHLVFTPEEIRQFPTPPVILREWPGWVKSWTKDPQMLENEDLPDLAALAGRSNVPAQTWQRVTGDAVNGYGLLEARAGASFRVDDQADETVLELIAESLELLEVRDPRRDFRTAAWNYTFTTSMQEQDNPADFRWRCIHSDNPAANRFATPDYRALSAVRATKLTAEETGFARTGRQPPQFVEEPQDTRATEGSSAQFRAKAQGVPNPTYQWFSVDRANNGQVLPGQTNPELTLLNPPIGISRYVVSVSNSLGNAQSRVATLSVEQKLKPVPQPKLRVASQPVVDNDDYQEIKDRQWRRLEAENIRQKQQRNIKIITILAVVLIVGISVYLIKGKPPQIKGSPRIVTNSELNKEDGGYITNYQLSVEYYGKTPLFFQWCSNGLPIESATNNILPLSKNTPSNSVSYYVIISNSIGSVKSSDISWPDITAPLAIPAPIITPPAETKTNRAVRPPLQAGEYNNSNNANGGTNQPKSNPKAEPASKKS